MEASPVPELACRRCCRASIFSVSRCLCASASSELASCSHLAALPSLSRAFLWSEMETFFASACSLSGVITRVPFGDGPRLRGSDSTESTSVCGEGSLLFVLMASTSSEAHLRTASQRRATSLWAEGEVFSWSRSAPQPWPRSQGLSGSWGLRWAQGSRFGALPLRWSEGLRGRRREGETSRGRGMTSCRLPSRPLSSSKMYCVSSRGSRQDDTPVTEFAKYDRPASSLKGPHQHSISHLCWCHSSFLCSSKNVSDGC
mmetsp:Transcript_8891/g.26093  ORF Transcript_8891/g.26093 Transcript_8891/m.26093 type:complete len:258 (+) Transcript_8891:341-1114(+)